MWHNVQEKHTNSLEKSDVALVKSIVTGHSKTAIEAYYLEFAIFPLKYYLSIRRLMYLWHILHREKDELIEKVYEAQKCDTNKGDWVAQV